MVQSTSLKTFQCHFGNFSFDKKTTVPHKVYSLLCSSVQGHQDSLPIVL